MPGVRLSNTIIRWALILSGRVTIRVLYDQGHAGNGPLPAGQYVVLPGPSDGGDRIPGCPALHFDSGALQDVQGRCVGDIVYPGRNWNKTLT